ncbi:YeiH family protein [Rhodococcus sp. O3]|uniref:YeiH family protein n=1 Tax=Rhodococcus sp. O3 TaxID=3404919 RepID=UPI003B679ADC
MVLSPTAAAPPIRTRLRTPLPGLAFCAVGAAAALGIAAPTGVSPLLVAIVLGATITNFVALPSFTASGIAVASRRLLRIGVALLGLQLLLSDVLGLGWGVLALAAAVVVGGIAGTMAVGRLLGMEWGERLLIACGFSICGAAAVAAVEGVTAARKQHVVTAVALVVVFGTAMIPGLPFAVSLLGLDTTRAGIWAGAAVHEVAQVVATGGAIDAGRLGTAGASALAVAVTVKLARVALLAPVVAWIGVVSRRRSTADSPAGRPPLVPLFLLGFVGFVALRATGLLPDRALDLARLAQTALLTTAMFALGTGVRISVLRGVGWRPFALAAVSTVWVSAIALGGVLLLDLEPATG